MTATVHYQRNWASWWALLFALVALFSNAGFFVALPGQRVIVWLSFACAALSLVFLAVGARRAFAQPEIYGSRSTTLVLGIFCLAISGFAVFASINARKLPSASAAPQIGQRVPDFTLTDTNGKAVSLTQLEHGTALGGAPGAATPKAVLLIFYRGYW
ncbi:MAG TPA: hypothetical protein VFB79_17665 [Candidatus Angelobacter sp.]|nr:hypothetical protein [Candidatus Angelobacter sp.]